MLVTALKPSDTLHSCQMEMNVPFRNPVCTCPKNCSLLQYLTQIGKVPGWTEMNGFTVQDKRAA